MKRFLIALLVHPFSFGAELPVVELVPEDRLGGRGYVQVKEIDWKADHPRFGKTVIVHQVAPGKPIADNDPLINFSKDFGMTRIFEWEDAYPEFGTPADGTVFYKSLIKGKPGVTWINPKNHYRYVTILPDGMNFPRDENEDPIVKPMPSKEKAVEMCREWMKKFGIDENAFVRDPKGIAGFAVSFGGGTETRWNEKLGRDVKYPIEMKVAFTHQTGDLPAFWNGFGGRYNFTFIDGGELRRAEWCIRPSEPLGEYELLSKDELIAAIREDFCWVFAPLKAETIEIVKVELEAYHARGGDPQKHFTPVWQLTARRAGQEEEKDVIIFIPALKQHRDKYPLVVEKAEE